MEENMMMNEATMETAVENEALSGDRVEETSSGYGKIGLALGAAAAGYGLYKIGKPLVKKGLAKLKEGSEARKEERAKKKAEKESRKHIKIDLNKVDSEEEN